MGIKKMFMMYFLQNTVNFVELIFFIGKMMYILKFKFAKIDEYHSNSTFEVEG